MKNIQKFAAALAATMMLLTITAFAEENSDSSSSSSTSSPTSSSTSSSSSSSESPKKNRSYGKKARLEGKKLNRGAGGNTVDASCMQTAVTTRENALIAAITARRDALVAAWGLTDVSASRNEAIKAAWSAYRTARKNAWKTFKSTVRGLCKVTDLGQDAGMGDGE